MAHLDAIGIVVSSMEAAIAFYRHLGLDFPPNSSGEGHVEVTTAGGLRVMFDTEDMLKSFSDWEPPAGGGQRNVLAFACETVEEVDRLHDLLATEGGASVLPPFDAPWGQRYATLADPDGNHLDLFAWQEGRAPE